MIIAKNYNYLARPIKRQFGFSNEDGLIVNETYLLCRMHKQQNTTVINRNIINIQAITNITSRKQWYVRHNRPIQRARLVNISHVVTSYILVKFAPWDKRLPSP